MEGATDGSLVDSWLDYGPNEYSLSQLDVSKRPKYKVDAINGRPGILFDGVDDNISVSFGEVYQQPNTVLSVIRFVTTPPTDAYPWMDGADSVNRHWVGSGISNQYSIWAGDPFLSSGVVKGTEPLVFSGVFSGSSSSTSADNGAPVSAPTGTQGMSGITLGSRWDGARCVNVIVCEVVAYNRKLSNEELYRVKQYLLNKYGLGGLIANLGQLPSSNKWAYGALADNGIVYGTPYQTSDILKMDVNSLDITTIPGPGGTNNQWIGLIASESGELFGVPALNPNVLVINPEDDSIRTFPAADYGQYYGGALADNGKIYCAPFSKENILVIDPTNDTSTTIGPVEVETVLTDGRWGWFTKDPVTGKLYGSPRNEPSVLVVDPSTDSIGYIHDGVPSGLRKYTGGVVAPSGEIWLIPRNAQSLCVIDPSNDTARSFGTLPVGVDKWNGGTVVGDWVVMFPRSYTSILAVNYLTDEIRYLSGSAGTDKWIGSVDTADHSILIPYVNTAVGYVRHSDLLGLLV